MTFQVLEQFIIILVATVTASLISHRLRLPAILNYLVVGFVVGPQVTGVVSEPETFHQIAEFGVAFLLFTLGLEFSLPKLIALRNTVFGMGTLQMLICMGVFGLLIWLYGVPVEGVLITAAAISLSSTAIVSKELGRHNEINTRHGQISIGILLFQDIAAVILLVVIPAVGGGAGESEVSLWQNLGWTGLKALGYFFAVVLAGKYLLPPLFTEISKIKSEELFVLTVLTVALSAAALAHALGLAMALGAFMAGMMLGESHFKHQIENEIRPFRDVLLGIFFVTIGFMIDLNMIMEYWPRIIFFAACLITFKSILIFLLCLLLGDARTNALRAGIVLCQGGEFGFALIALGQKDALLQPEVAAFFVSIIVLSMIATPFLVKRTGRIANAIFKARVVPQTHAYDLKRLETVVLDSTLPHVVIAGYGRVGQIIARFLKQKDIPYVAIDDDPLLVGNARDAGENVYYGNARQVSLLEKVGLEQASMLIVSFDDHATAERLVHALREKYAALPILVRTRDDAHLASLKEAGATEVIPEILEASIMIASHVMATLKVPRKEVTLLMKKVRRERYQMLKGYFEGEEILASEDFDAAAPILRPVTLPEGAFAVGKLLTELALEGREVKVDAVRRHDEIIAVDAVQDLQAMDVLILNGLPSQLEAAEAYLLVGA
ncbi:MAG: cation:proton antiporter [Hahellaceae bacterium]|nr:cation:proton antiporter [Hahellaceae bacterium]MCP5170577.1 cation:proton antiporter [Hahellaceae bacterium]